MYHIQKTTTTTTKTAFPRVWTILAKSANAELTFLALDLDQGNADLMPTQCITSSDHAALRDEGVINTTACTYTPISLSCQVMTEWVPPEHREIHDLLINWGRWAITPKSQAHCASIEHRFKSPQCWNNPEPKTEHNEQLAFLIERSMRIIPKLSRKLLKLKYVLKADKQFISKRLRLHVERYDQLLYDQLLYTSRQIALNLTRHQLAPTMHGRFNNLRLPTTVEISP